MRPMPIRLGLLGLALACGADDGRSRDDAETTDTPQATATTAPATTGDEDDSAATDTTTTLTASSGDDDGAQGTTTSDDVGDETTSAPEVPGTTGGDDGGSAECDALMACCEQIGADVYAGCVQVVDLAMPGLCDSILDTYHQEGYCTGESFCAELEACCGELPPGPGWEETCTYYADLGNQPQCAMLIGDYQLSGYCF